MKQRFVENKETFSSFRLLLFRTLKKSPLRNLLFRHLLTWDIWERYEYETDEANRLTEFAYRMFPYPPPLELIEIAIHSKSEDEIKGACRLLYQLEFKGLEYRADLIKKMEHSIDNITENRFQLIYENANLINQGNLRYIMNKSDKEISSDLAHYQQIYQRTEKIKERISAVNNG